MGWFSKFTDDVLGFDPGGGGIYGAARDVLGDTIADDMLGMDPNGGGAVGAYNVIGPLALGAAAAGYFDPTLFSSATTAGAGAASEGAALGSGLSAGSSGLGLSAGGGLGLTAGSSAFGAGAAASSLPSWLAPAVSAGGSLLGGIASNPVTAAAIAGGLLGSSKDANSATTSSQYRMDSRLDPYVYGGSNGGGLLSEAANLYRQQMANGGLNDNQRQGLEMQRQALTSPQYTQGLDAMRSQGFGLLNGGIAGNPFMNGSRTIRR